MARKSIHPYFLKLSLFIFTLTLLTLYCNAGYAKTRSTTLNLPTFSSIDATGNIKIILADQQEKQSVTIFAPPEIVKQMKVSVQNRTLFINVPPIKNQSVPIFIHIKMSQPVKNISLAGSACLWGEHLSNPNMNIALRNSANIHLQGTPHSIQNDGAGSVVITGINREVLMVRGNGSGRIAVSGRVKELNAEIGGSLVLKAQRLHAEVGHILTQNNATAYVCVFGPLHAFAYNDSNIYYFYNPSRIVRDTHASGNVLKLNSDRRLVEQE